MLYRETKDILYVKQQLGHNNIKNTLIYTQLLVDEEPDKYTCRVSDNPKETQNLIENGFEYIRETKAANFSERGSEPFYPLLFCLGLGLN
jgi:hypothetical protein